MNVRIIGGWPADTPPPGPGQVVYRWWRDNRTLARMAQRIIAGERLWRIWRHHGSAFDIL